MRIKVSEEMIIYLPVPYRLFALSEVYENSATTIALYVANGYILPNGKGAKIFSILKTYPEGETLKGEAVKLLLPEGRTDHFQFSADTDGTIRAEDESFEELTNTLRVEGVFHYKHSQISAHVNEIVSFLKSARLNNRLAPAFLKAILSYPFYVLGSEDPVPPLPRILRKSLEVLISTFPDVRGIPEVMRLAGTS